MRIEHLMTKDPVACRADEALTEAACLMRDRNVGCVVALDDADRVVGILTDRQVALAACGGGAEGLTVEDVMEHEVACLHPDDTVFHAVDAFRGAGVVRRLPVVDDEERLVGLLSISDVAVVAEKLMSALFLEERHHAMDEARLLTGAKRIVKRIRRPKKAGRIPERPARPVGPAVRGRAAASGRGSQARGGPGRGGPGRGGPGRGGQGRAGPTGRGAARAGAQTRAATPRAASGAAGARAGASRQAGSAKRTPTTR